MNDLNKDGDFIACMWCPYCFTEFTLILPQGKKIKNCNCIKCGTAFLSSDIDMVNKVYKEYDEKRIIPFNKAA